MGKRTFHFILQKTNLSIEIRFSFVLAIYNYDFLDYLDQIKGQDEI